MVVTSFSKLGRLLATIAGLAVIAIGLGLAIAWFMGSHGSGLPSTDAGPAPQAPNPTSGATAPKPTPADSRSADALSTNALPDLDSRPWDTKLDEILLSGDDENMKADKILALIPTAPEEAQVELSQHLINMVQDDHYDGAAQLLTNATTQVAVSTVLMNDLLNRRNTLKLPMLLAVARNDDHPLKGQAKDMLELFLQEDYGTDWDKWSAAVDTWLTDNQ